MTTARHAGVSFRKRTKGERVIAERLMKRRATRKRLARIAQQPHDMRPRLVKK